MDPQQRLLLEAAFEARVPLTKGRLNPPDETGVFIGSSCVDWFLVHAKLPSRDGPSCFVADLQHAMLANRISYCMNLEGASMTIDTATSSGIVAFCTAVSHIESNRMLCALAGSSQLIIAPEVTVALCNLGMLSRTGRCRPFDEASDGFIRSEGVIVFSLVREDYVSEFVDTSAVQPLAFVRGHAVVHSGRAFSTTAPSESAERRVMEGALAKAKMTPDEVDYIEAHGTGTRMGDAVEMQSLAAVFGESHEYARPLLVGSIKGNIGHCEGSSGGAGICKAILVLINRCVPATVHFNRLSSLIDRTPRYFFIPRAATQVPIADRSLVVGVSSFGVGGCNGHVILEGPKTNSHDFKTQLNDKCAWKRNRFPWSHLIDIPGHNNEVGSPIEMGIPASARASSSFSFEDTALSIVDSFLDESIDESVPVPSMDTRILRNGSQTKMTGSRSGSLQDLSLTTGNCVKGVPVEEPAKHIAASFHSEDAGSTHLGGSSPHGYTNTVPSAVQCGRSEALSTSMPSISRQKIRAAVDESLRLALNRNEAIEETTPFVEAGVDSMTSIGIRESLSKKLEIQLPATLLYDHPCIAELVPRLEQLLCEDRGVSTNQAIHPGLWHATDEKDVAVTALSCRLPPGSYCESEFWEGLKAGQDCIQHIPLSRFDPWKYRTSGASPSEKLYVSDAGTFPDMCLFDNALFNISPAEAQLMDPHQRILLEVCHETIAPALDDRSLVDLAIIVGCCNNDWVRETCTSAQEAKSLSGTGSAASIVSNRLSYVFNLHGPSMTIDTACSSSLVALDVAKHLLSTGRCTAALAGGVHVLINHYVFEQYCKAHMLSIDGRCKTFDASANGYVRSEGCGAVLLQALPRESTNPNSVYAWIRGAANNHVGRSASLTAPNGPAQQAVIRAALRDARIQSPADISVLEAHGTGTSLGDPIEVGAVRAVYCNGFADRPPLIIGALKSLMGHAEGAAGIAGLIKLILVLQHRTATPNLHLITPNPHIDLSRGDKYRDLLFPSKCIPLDTLLGIQESQPLLGAVSSFGFGGSNAHAIVEVEPTFKATWTDGEEQLVAGSSDGRATVVWLFTGQGSQYLDMASAYFHHSALFRDTISACTAQLKEMNWFPADGPQSIEDLVYGAESLAVREKAEEILSQTQYSQVAIFAIELGLSKVLLEQGLKPDIVIGHSLGEYAAATVAGVMEWKDALCLVAKRAALLAAQPNENGVMVACRLSAAAVQAALTTELQQLQAVSLAGDNGPNSVTIAGAKEQVDLLLEHLGVSANSKRLHVSHAFHSPLMAGAVSEMEALASQVNLQPASITIASTVRGRTLDSSEAQNPRYWSEQLTLPVRFREAVEAAVEASKSDRIVFVEIGPQRTLVNLAKQVVARLASVDARYFELSGRDRQGESLQELELHVKEIVAAILADRPLRWNHKKFPFPFETKTRSPKYYKPAAPSQKDFQIHHGPFWKTVWKNVPLPEAQRFSLPEQAEKWLFCGVPGEYVCDFRNVLSLSGIKNAQILEANGIPRVSTLPRLPSGNEIEGVVFVGGLWSSQSSTVCIEELRQILLAYHRTAEKEVSFHPPLCVVVRCSNSAFGVPSLRHSRESEEDCEIRHSGLLGMCRTARLEIQRLCKRSVTVVYANVEDEGPQSFSKALSWINTQFGLVYEGLPILEEDIIITPSSFLAPRLQPMPIPEFRGTALVSLAKSYLITGGTGGLGLAVAQWLLNQGAGLVVLLSRSGKPNEALRQTTAWKAVEDGICEKKAEIMVCDVVNRSHVRDTLYRVHRKRPLGGIFHCAGFEGDASILHSNIQRIQLVYDPKANGAWNLHVACQQLQLENGLDFFVLFSSISTLPGNDALAPYAAANTYLDSLAYFRASQGLHAKSIQWGPWADVGMVTRNNKFERIFNSRGIKPFVSGEAIQIMEQALQNEEPCICALVVDWRMYSRAFDDRIPRTLEDLVRDEQTPTQHSQEKKITREFIESVVLDAATSLVNQESSITPETHLESLGLDSLGSVELRNMIQERLAISLPASLLLEFASLCEVIDYIAEDMTKRSSAGFTSSAKAPVPQLSVNSDEGFAVIGMGCRLPGNSDSPEAFWNMLLAGSDCIKNIPWQRFNIQPLFDPDPDENKCYVKEAALLDNAHLFDNQFFRMSENQARNIDPQQRVLLEVAYETFVDAQYGREELKGQDIGVFCATYTNEYQLTSLTKGESGILAIGEGADGGVPRLGEASGYPEPGGMMCLIPNRISYALGLIGASVGVDTACASGLVAMDTAVMKLKLCACSKAFVGAVSLILAPCFFLGGSKTRQFSKSGRCRTFDAGADGLVRGEGAAGVLLAPLRTARAESKFVHAIVRGIATSHYGQGARLTAPNTRALVRVLNLALEDGKVNQSLVRCYEAHGTATVLGDIIEMNAVKHVFENRSAEAPLIVGTAHNNIGHLDSAAALVAFVKTVLSLKHRYVPSNIQFNKLHPNISPFDKTKIIYTREGQDIHTADKARLFGANLAYGLGGTVVAAITEEGDNPSLAPTITRHTWNHNSFPLDAQKFVFLLGAASQLAQDRKQTPTDDVAYLTEYIFKNSLSKQSLAALDPCTPPDSLSEIFLTGATGLTGSQILCSLLEQRTCNRTQKENGFLRIYCLVQARDRMHAMYRIVDAVVGRGQRWKPRYFKQIIPVVGDLKAPRLGLSPQNFATLARTIDAVYHAGRDVDFGLPYEAIRKANVLSLLPLVELCTKGKAKPLHVLSDFAAHIQYFAAFGDDLNRPLPEELSVPRELIDRMENQMPASVVGYPWARWAVEEVLANCQRWVKELAASADAASCNLESKFTFTIYRLPNSAVYFNTGRVDFRNSFFAITMAALQQGVLPPGVLPVGPPFLSTPIDVSADILVTISRMATRPSVIHIVNPTGVRRQAIKQTLLELEIPFRESTVDEFLRGLEKNQNSSCAYHVLPLMRYWRSYWFSDDLDRKEPFPIETRNLQSCLPDALNLFPSPGEVWTRMLAYLLGNYHLVRDPFDTILPRGLLERIGKSLVANAPTNLSTDTQQMLKTALLSKTNEELEHALEWNSEQFLAHPLYKFLPAPQ
ncbi:uncharacterized protein LOC34623811 [Cyclospora cayetanensis]|uniref:Uncharacterized protein LOC34623811 n=1 Tax=Cyclospora cayetanensis TaxID=88456 RepID=A0A6P6RYD7_9EIME|nr:uncharacterized protein LOC34623811 [Cyclospora cayetanensis]